MPALFPNLKRLLSRRSRFTYDAVVPLFRPTLEASSVATRRARSGGNSPPLPSPLKSNPASGEKGRPEAAVKIVEMRIAHGSSTSPESTKRWRWSWVAGPSSESGSKPSGRPSLSFGLRPKPLFCGMKLLWKSVELSSAFEYVYETRNWCLRVKRLFTETVTPLYSVSPKEVYWSTEAELPGMPPFAHGAAGFAEQGRSLGLRAAPRRAGSTGL